MLLVVQHVLVPGTRTHGYNVYRYGHGLLSPWPADPASRIDDLKVRLIDRDEEIAPGGNRILSFLDVLAPTQVDLEVLLERFDALAEHHASPPQTGRFDDLQAGFRLGLAASLRKHWKDELGALTDSLLLVG